MKLCGFFTNIIVERGQPCLPKKSCLYGCKVFLYKQILFTQAVVITPPLLLWPYYQSQTLTLISVL